MSTANLDSADLKAATYKGLIREDIMNRIFDISRIPLPFTDLIGTDTHTNEYAEWTLDTLATPDITNAAVDGADTTGNNTVIGTRVGNHSQISTKVVRVSFRADASDVIGRTKESGYQIMRRQQELRRDVEAICLTNQASVADDGNTTAGKIGGLPSWIASHNYGGTAGGFSTSTGLTVARLPTATRALTETLVRDAVQAVYQDGGDPTVLMTIPGVVRKFSEYLFTSSARVATLVADQGKSTESATALGSVNVFVTDFGTLKLIPNRLQKTHVDSGSTQVADVFILDPSYLSLSYMKGYRTEDLARTGLAENKLMSVDYTLKVLTEKSHAIIGDISTTLAVTL
jgi:hypothetical protein